MVCAVALGALLTATGAYQGPARVWVISGSIVIAAGLAILCVTDSDIPRSALLGVPAFVAYMVFFGWTRGGPWLYSQLGGPAFYALCGVLTALIGCCLWRLVRRTALAAPAGRERLPGLESAEAPSRSLHGR